MSYKIDCLKCVESDWYHKWCPLYGYRLNDYVKGPLKYPMVTVPIPYEIREKDNMDRCDCAKHLKECYSKPGIPDPWSEYLILRRETEKGNDVSSDFPKCDLDITGYLYRNYRVYLGQGIPDPWKKWTRIEPLEPSIGNLRQKWKSYLENLRIGPGCDMYDVDKVSCPNCNRQLLVLCLKKSNQEEKQVEKDVVKTDPVSKPAVEKLVEQKVHVKDACVETDHLPDVKNNEVETSKPCGCKSSKICGCNDKCLSCPVCNKSRNEEKTEPGSYKKSDSCCNCKKNSVRNGYVYNAGSNCPVRMRNITDESDGPPLQKINYGHQGTVLPFFCSNSDRCTSARQFTGCEEKNSHGLELQLICPKCEKKRKRRRQTKCGQREENRLPCHCRNNERTRFQKYTHENECECCACDRAHKPTHFRERIKPNTSCYGEHRCRKYSEDRDYVRLLEVLGCTGLYFNKPDMDCEISKTTPNKISKGKRRSFTRLNSSLRTDNTSDILGRGFRDWERACTDHKYEISRRSTGMKNDFETFHNDSKCDKKCRSPNYSLYEVRKMRNHLRSQKSRNAFRKELSYFLSNSRRKEPSNDSELSSETGPGGMSGEIKADQSGWKKDGNIISGGQKLEHY